MRRLKKHWLRILVHGVGLLPLVLGGQEPGREILYPVATVILGGLITSTALTLLIIPAVYKLLDRGP